MKKICSVLITICLVALVFAGCGKDARQAYNEDMKKYVTMGQYKGIVVDRESEIYKNYYNSIYEGDVSSADAYNKITEGTVAVGDLVNITYVGRKASNGEIFTGDTSSDTNDGKETSDLSIGSGAFVEGFEDQLVGAAVGNQTKVQLTFPDDYYEDLAGKDVIFDVTVNYIKKLPELNDTFAISLGYGNVSEYKEYLDKSAIENCIYNSIISGFAVNSLSKNEKAKYDAIYNELINNAQQQVELYKSQYNYDITLDEALYYMVGATSAQITSIFEEQQKVEMIFFAIFDEARLKFSDSDINNAVAQLAKEAGITEKQIKENYEQWQLETAAVKKVTMDYMINNAEIK